MKAGLIIFLVIYAFLFVFGAKSVTEFNKVPVGEKRVLAAVLFALPLIGVRIAWSFIAYFGHGSTFSIISGSSMAIVVRAFMSLLEEFLVVIAYTIVGLLVPPAYGSQYDVEGQATGTQQPQGFYPLHQVGGPQVAPELPSYTYQRSGEPPGRQ